MRDLVVLVGREWYTCGREEGECFIVSIGACSDLHGVRAFSSLDDGAKGRP